MPPKSKYPCGVCKKQCVDLCVFCESCFVWFHYFCEDMTSRQFKSLSDNCFPYMCQGCTSLNGRYNFLAALQRLKERTTSGKIKDAGIIEDILARRTRLPKKFTQGKLVPCSSASFTVKRSKTFDRVPVHVNGDGNCLFNATSCAMFGSDKAALHIRLRAAIVMATKPDEIQAIHRNLKLDNVCWGYELALKDACTNCAFSNAYHMIAISIALT